jgi:two-component system response regulator (stage 0 sporulation protein F)
MSAARVLVVGDEPVALEIVSRMLNREGYQVFRAAGPRQAHEIVREQSPIDLIVSGISMPEMQGTELVREVARIAPQTARVLMTGGEVEPTEVPDHHAALISSRSW